jgi:cerevisin
VLESDGSGTLSDILKAFEFIVKDAAPRKAKTQCKKGLVANVSLGGSFSKAMNDAVSCAVDGGVWCELTDIE